MSAELYFALVILATGALVATACALLGTFLVLRRMALIGDAISHAILPGIAIGFILTHSRHSLVMFLGAAAAGLATVWLVEMLYRSRRVHADTAIAIVFPALFALGVLLIHPYKHLDLDVDCVYLGEIGSVPDRTLTLAGQDLGPKALWVLGGANLLNLVFVLLCYKELKLCTFDSTLSASLGYSPTWLHYLLMTVVSITTVAAFESVGAILVVAFLIIPPAAAYLLTDRLWLMLLLAVALGLWSVVTGYVVALEEVLNCSPSGAMAGMTGVWFLLVWLLAPRHGLLATLFRRRRLRRQFAGDLLLLHLAKTARNSRTDPLEGLGWPPGRQLSILRDLERRGLVTHRHVRPELTPTGEVAAAALSLRAPS